jgi:ribonucleoside-diphosphate reductase alpha chain
MRLASEIHSANPAFGLSSNPASTSELKDFAEARYSDYKIIRRNGSVAPFAPDKIAIAMTKAFLAVNGGQEAASARMRDQVSRLTETVIGALVRHKPSGGTFHIEEVQDQVELALMRGGAHEVARAYVLYREQRSQERARQREVQAEAVNKTVATLNVLVDGQKRPLDVAALSLLIKDACADLGDAVNPKAIFDATLRDLYDGVPQEEVFKAATLAARTMIEQDPAYTKVTARLLMHQIRTEVLGEEVLQPAMATRYAEYFPQYIKRGIEAELLDEKLGHYDLAILGKALNAERDTQFTYLGLQTLYDRYFIHKD